MEEKTTTTTKTMNEMINNIKKKTKIQDENNINNK